MKLSLGFGILCAAAGAVFGSIGGAAAQQSVEEFYKGKTVTLVISATPGGSADIFGRAFADYLGKYIPGNPRIAISNQAGAGGIVAGTRLQTSAARDGTVIAVLQRNNFYLPLVSEEKIAFDPRKVSWIGSLAKETNTVMVRSNAPAQKAEELFQKPLRLGATSFGNENATLPAMMNEYFGTKFDIVVGYDGNEALALAIERGEVHGRVMIGLPPSEAAQVREGKLKIIMQLGIDSDPTYPDAPNIMSYTKDPEVLALAKFILAPMDASRPFAVPAEVPADRLAALRKAFDAAAADPEFVAAMQKLNLPVSPITGQAVENIIASLYAAPPSVIAKVQKLLKPK